MRRRASLAADDRLKVIQGGLAGDFITLREVDWSMLLVPRMNGYLRWERQSRVGRVDHLMEGRWKMDNRSWVSASTV